MNLTARKKLIISSNQIEDMRSYMEACYPEEGCGILGGFDDRVVWVIPITNLLHSSTRFQMDPREQVDAFFQIEDDGGEIIGIYHSHPLGPEFPSDSDIRASTLPDAVQIIWYPLDEEWTYQAYRIDPAVGVVPVEINVLEP